MSHAITVELEQERQAGGAGETFRQGRERAIDGQGADQNEHDHVGPAAGSCLT